MSIDIALVETLLLNLEMAFHRMEMQAMYLEPGYSDSCYNAYAREYAQIEITIRQAKEMIRLEKLLIDTANNPTPVKTYHVADQGE